MNPAFTDADFAFVPDANAKQIQLATYKGSESKMRGKIHSLAMLSAFVSLAAFMVQEVDARGGRGGGGGGGRGGGGFSRGGSSSMSRGGGGGVAAAAAAAAPAVAAMVGGGSRGGSGFQPWRQLQPTGGGGYSRPTTTGQAAPAASAVLDGRAASVAPATRRRRWCRRRWSTWWCSAASVVPAVSVVSAVSAALVGAWRCRWRWPARAIGAGGGNKSAVAINVNNGNINTGDINIDNDWGGGDWNGWGDYPIGAGIAIGAVAGMTAMAYGSAYYALPRGCSPYAYHSYTYYNCGGAYYQPQYEGDTVVYVTVPDPATVTRATIGRTQTWVRRRGESYDAKPAARRLSFEGGPSDC